MYILYTDFVEAENSCIFGQRRTWSKFFIGKNRR